MSSKDEIKKRLKDCEDRFATGGMTENLKLSEILHNQATILLALHELLDNTGKRGPASLGLLP